MIKLNKIINEIFRYQPININSKKWYYRWFFSTNHLDIGTLYLIFGYFGGNYWNCFFNFNTYTYYVFQLIDFQILILILYNVIITSRWFNNDFFYGYAYFNGTFGNIFSSITCLEFQYMAFPRLNNYKFLVTYSFYLFF